MRFVSLPLSSSWCSAVKLRCVFGETVICGCFLDKLPRFLALCWATVQIKCQHSSNLVVVNGQKSEYRNSAGWLMPLVRSCFETAMCISFETTPIHSPFVFCLYPCLVISRHVANPKPTFLYLSFVLACHVFNYSRVTTTIRSSLFCILLVLLLLSSFSGLLFWFSNFCVSVSTFFCLCTSVPPSASFLVPSSH